MKTLNFIFLHVTFLILLNVNIYLLFSFLCGACSLISLINIFNSFLRKHSDVGLDISYTHFFFFFFFFGGGGGGGWVVQ